jgi:hypothetical protein
MTTKSIWKFPLAYGGIKVSMPIDSQILCVQAQHNDPQLWALVDPLQPGVDRYFEIYGTGHEIFYDMGTERKYIGTFQVDNGKLVFHVFENTGIYPLLNYIIMDNKISALPWKVYHPTDAYWPGIDSKDGGGDAVVAFGEKEEECGIRGDTREHAIANASAIVSAVNFTYGAGINPEAVADLLKACKEGLEWLNYAGQTGGQVNYDAMQLLRSAIEKSKLPTP